ncbi:MAG TPA: DNA polymerase Y family protein [Candidatus Limnocylindria bacterium]|nr:DNA polymerase Y family protein [Candidatus Limnocylindria bacterium]
MRLLHLHRQHLLLDLARRRRLPSGSWPQGPVVLGGAPWSNGNVLDADSAARALGVRRGMPLGSAHRLAPEATFLDADPEADRAELEAAFERLGRFSPAIAGTSEPADVAFGLLEAQIDGLEGLWGLEPALVERVGAALESALAGPPRAGIAGTRFAATVAALAAEPGTLVSVPPGAEAVFLAPLPASLLTPDADIRARLRRFGLRRIGQVAELAASALVARFGEEGARIGSRSRGQEVDPFRPRRAPERLVLGLPIEPAVTELEAIRFVLRRLAVALGGSLAARGLAAEQGRLRLELDLAFARAGTPPELMVETRFPEPTADAEAIERLLLAKLERTPPPAAVARLELELNGASPAAGQQLPLFVPQALHGARLAWQLARLALTYGEDRIQRVEVTDPEAPLPERRWAWRDAGEGEAGARESGQRDSGRRDSGGRDSGQRTRATPGRSR